jgi:hypothetical protein
MRFFFGGNGGVVIRTMIVAGMNIHRRQRIEGFRQNVQESR